MRVPIACLSGVTCLTISTKCKSSRNTEGKRIVETCAAANVPLMVHENWRFQSVFQEVLNTIASGELGTVLGFADISITAPDA